MVLGGFLLFQTESALFDVNKFLDETTCPIVCGEISLENLEDRNFYFLENENPTQHIRYESEYQELSVFEIYPELRAIFAQTREAYLPIKNIRDDIRDLESQIRNLEYQNEREQKNYETGLLEDIANSDGQAFDSKIGRANINSARSKIDKLNSQISDQQRQEDVLEKKFGAILAPFKAAHDSALKKYRSARRAYGFKLMLIRLMLTIPLLLLGAWWYRRAQEKQSKYTILPLILMVVSSITFLQVIVMYASNWIPFTFFEKFFGWLMKLAFGGVIVHYIIVFIGVVVVGGLIVSLQKKLFSGKRQFLRRLNKGECPFCAFPMKHSDEFCVGCGEKLKINCVQCGKLTLKMLTHCQHCGENPKKITK